MRYSLHDCIQWKFSICACVCVRGYIPLLHLCAMYSGLHAFAYGAHIEMREITTVTDALSMCIVFRAGAPTDSIEFEHRRTIGIVLFAAAAAHTHRIACVSQQGVFQACVVCLCVHTLCMFRITCYSDMYDRVGLNRLMLAYSHSISRLYIVTCFACVSVIIITFQRGRGGFTRIGIGLGINCVHIYRHAPIIRLDTPARTHFNLINFLQNKNPLNLSAISTTPIILARFARARVPVIRVYVYFPRALACCPFVCLFNLQTLRAFAAGQECCRRATAAAARFGIHINHIRVRERALELISSTRRARLPTLVAGAAAASINANAKREIRDCLRYAGLGAGPSCAH